MRRFLLATALPCTIAACEGARVPSAASGGTLLVATGEPDALLPPLIKSIIGKQVADMIFLPIAHIGDSLNLVGDEGFTPGLAARWEWAPDSLSIAFHLDPRARWHDGAPVRASDVAWTLRTYRDPAVSADHVANLASIDSVTVRDSLTFVTWYSRRSATQFYDLVYHLTPLPEHVYGTIPADSLATSAAARAPIGSGRFRLARWLPGERVEVVADTTHWLGRPSLDRVAFLATPDQTSQVSRLLAGEADMVELLRGAALASAAKDTSIRLLSRPSFDYAVAMFNTRDPRNLSRPHPILGEAAMRRALTMAVDRATLVANVLDTLGIPMESPFLSEHRIAGVDLLPFDTLRAVQLLDSLGWHDTNGDGVRERGGRTLEFGISAPSISAARSRAAVILQEMFKRVGARAHVRSGEHAVLTANDQAGKFDLSLMGFSGNPNPGTVRQYFRSNLGGQGSNWSGYASAAFDAVIDSATQATTGSAARALYGRAGRILAADAPAIWLYELRSVSGLHSRFRPAIMRADAWWAHIDEWSVDPAHLKARDRIGPGVSPTPR